MRSCPRSSSRPDTCRTTRKGGCSRSSTSRPRPRAPYPEPSSGSSSGTRPGTRRRGARTADAGRRAAGSHREPDAVRLDVELFGTHFQNPVLLAAGTCGFGMEVAEVIDLERLGGLVTKSVTVEPRNGNPPLRVSEFPGG